METYSVEYWQKRGVNIYAELPKGWRIVGASMTSPAGYVWIDNGKSRFNPFYKHGLMKLNM